MARDRSPRGSPRSCAGRISNATNARHAKYWRLCTERSRIGHLTGASPSPAWAYTRPGVTVEVAVRTLVAHEDSDHEEWGASGSVRIDPGASGRGLSVTLTPAWGNAESGTGWLWGLADA